MFVKKSGTRTSLWISTVLLLGFATVALANKDPNRLLHGDYAITQMMSCIQTKNVFDVPSFELNDTTGQWETTKDVETNVLSLTGISRFDGKGNWQLLDSKALIITQGDAGAGETRVRESALGCEGTYQAQHDGTFRVAFTSCQLTNPPFFVFGQNGTIDGRISQDKKTLVLWDNEPNVDQLALPNGGPVVFERICNAIATDVRAVRKKSKKSKK